MATQTFYSAYVGNLRSYIVVNEKSQDVAGNRTLISYSVYANKRYSHNPFNNFNQTPVQVTINGTRVYNANVNYDLSGRTTQLIASGETYVAHNNDGTKALTVSMSVDFSSTGTSFGYGKTTATGSMNLTTIARASTFSLSSYSFDFDASIAMTINRSSSSFTHNVTYTQPNGTTTSVSTTATTSATLNIPISLATQIPNTTSYVSKITVQTKNSSGTVIGSNTTNVTVVLNARYKPSISALNPTGPNATIGNNTTSIYNYLGGVNKVGTTITASGSNGSTISFTEYRLLNSSNAQVSTVTINGTGGASFTAPTVPSTNALFTLQARVADSRGRYSDWKSASIKIRSHYYKTPSIWGATVGRSTSNQNYMVGRVSWSTVSVYNAGGTSGQINTASMVFRYRKKGVTSWTTLTTNTALSTTNYALPFNSTVFASSDTFEFIGEITDKFGNKAQTAIVTVNGTFVHMDFGPKGVGIGKDHSDSNYDLEVGSGGISSQGSMFLGGNLNMEQYSRVSSSPIRINLGGIGDYNKAVIALSKLNVDGSHSLGKVMATRQNGLYGATQADINFTSAYNSNSVYADVINYGPNQFKVCTFMYGGVPYGGLEVFPGAAQYSFVEFHGMSNMNPFMVDYYDTRGTVLNSEINSSISFTANIQRNNNLLYGNNKMWHQGNDGSGSGLDADLLDGLHASSFAKVGDIPSIPSYSGGNNTSNGYYIIGDYQVAYGSMPVAAISGLSQTRGGSRNFYRAFSEIPYVQVSMDAKGNYLSGMAYVHSVTKTGFTAAIYDSGGFGSTQAQNRLINYFAIGRK